MKKLLSVLFLLAMLGFLSGCARVEKPAPDYRSLLIRAAVHGDTEAGHLAAQERNAQLDELGSPDARVDFDELLLLSRYLTLRAGNERQSDTLRFCTGEVLLNRVASPEFPDTLAEVLGQEGEYPETQTGDFAALLPSRPCVETALDLLLGSRLLDERTVYQCEGTPRGTVCATFCDRWYHTTYFCLSEHPELYERAG